MATVGQTLNRSNPDRPATWYTGEVTAVSGRLLTCTLDNSTASIRAIAVDPVPAAGSRVLIVATATGNFCVGTIG
ncbi:hypothetical protein AB0M47_33240 [Hamadaea sp. NPDC051192]|uniref:hypothetical protein n=1 Tax=Hamadaea sp. NPDC051192 TaxID=3154940 RepID=UPI003430ADB1